MTGSNVSADSSSNDTEEDFCSVSLSLLGILGVGWYCGYDDVRSSHILRKRFPQTEHIRRFSSV